jgi:hypothetical protein
MYFDNELSGIIRNLTEKNVCNVVEWVGECEDCTIHLRKSLKYENFVPSTYKKYDHQIYDQIVSDFFRFFIFQNRLKKIYAKNYKFYDHLDFFNLYFRKFFDILVSKQVDVVLFPNLPHLGIDYLVYRIAKALNIRTILFYQSLFPNRFFYLEDIEDFGVFSKMQKEFDSDQIEIVNNHKKEIFYMKRSPYPIEFDLRSYLKKCKTKLKQRKRRIYEKQFKENLNSAICTDFDLDKDFVYFPLHLQPELTTSLLGGTYIDQALALERLHEIIPKEWFIYVKENPKQNTEYMRGKGFFQRLKTISNLKIVPSDTDTYLLMENSRFVSTITGTAGWEAITGGKKALIFGNAWYKNLPGVFSYHANFNINTMLEYKIDHHELVKSVSSMVNRMPHGVIDLEYSVIVEGYQEDLNCTQVAEFIKSILD